MPRQANRYALFVKENFKRFHVQGQNAKTTMKKLAEEWRKMKNQTPKVEVSNKSELKSNTQEDSLKDENLKKRAGNKLLRKILE